ncbi:Zn(2)-C6 fungal-type DNA-binding domain protein [Niveomyces insectorum RCEF 264]|uniref:Zn(2)-C6 fungal-type DNA-binding domain protein n=1 Tax=Niveomyces insectorum RCEF 264 TaxID=1081102 RepID=A0A167MB46_9HYPO|nr:Zn(2)-C6 fungal-type DNA-binding domain protein [Niveomyces insectorum RCEF 264]
MVAHPRTAAAARTNTACGSCRFRKVKCSGTHPCAQCAHLGLRCAFSPPAGKRKHGTRGALVKQLKERHAPSPCTSQAALLYPAIRSSSSADSTTTTASPPRIPTRSPADRGGIAGVPPYPANDNTPPSHAAYAPDLFLALVPDYARVVYPVNPIITPDEIRTAVATMHSAAEDAALVYAFAAITIIFIQPSWASAPVGSDGNVSALMADLMQRGLAAHRAAETTQGELAVTVKRIMTCVFLEMSMLSTRLYDRGFVMLREAISLTQTLRVFRYDAAATRTMDRHEVARCQRLYWECFLHERFLYIVSGRPAILPPLSTGPPLADPSIPPNVEAGFGRLIDLFRIMDDTFLRYWCADAAKQHPDPTCQPVPAMTAEWVERKQAELDEEERKTAEVEECLRAAAASASAGCGGGGGGGGCGGGCGTCLSELQRVDIFITRLWLRTLVWQLALSRGLLRSAPPRTAHEGLSLHFPADRLSAQLRGLVCRLESAASIATHGSGILQKLFEITTTIADVLALPPGQMRSPEDVRARMDDLVFLVNFLFRFDKVRQDERDYIREKLGALQQLYGYDFVHVDADSLAVRPTGAEGDHNREGPAEPQPQPWSQLYYC